MWNDVCNMPPGPQSGTGFHCSNFVQPLHYDSLRKTKSAPQSPIKTGHRLDGVVGSSKTDAFHIIHKVPTGDSPYVRAKHVQLVDKDPDRAIALFWAAINSGDRVDSALKDMAIVMKQQNRPEEAIEAIKSLRVRCSEQAHESLDNVLLDLYKRCGRLDDQIALLKHKLDMIHQGVAFNGKRTKTARSQGKKFQVSIEQEATRLLGNLGWAYMQQSNYIAAESVYRKALSIEPDNNKVCNLGICLMKQGRVDEARLMLQSVTPCGDSRWGSESHVKSYERAQEMLRELEVQVSQQRRLAEQGATNDDDVGEGEQALVPSWLAPPSSSQQQQQSTEAPADSHELPPPAGAAQAQQQHTGGAGSKQGSFSAYVATSGFGPGHAASSLSSGSRKEFAGVPAAALHQQPQPHHQVVPLPCLVGKGPPLFRGPGGGGLHMAQGPSSSNAAHMQSSSDAGAGAPSFLSWEDDYSTPPCLEDCISSPEDEVYYPPHLVGGGGGSMPEHYQHQRNNGGQLGLSHLAPPQPHAHAQAIQWHAQLLRQRLEAVSQNQGQRQGLPPQWGMPSSSGMSYPPPSGPLLPYARVPHSMPGAVTGDNMQGFQSGHGMCQQQQQQQGHLGDKRINSGGPQQGNSTIANILSSLSRVRELQVSSNSQQVYTGGKGLHGGDNNMGMAKERMPLTFDRTNERLLQPPSRSGSPACSEHGAYNEVYDWATTGGGLKPAAAATPVRLPGAGSGELMQPIVYHHHQQQQQRPGPGRPNQQQHYHHQNENTPLWMMGGGDGGGMPSPHMNSSSSSGGMVNFTNYSGSVAAAEGRRGGGGGDDVSNVLQPHPTNGLPPLHNGSQKRNRVTTPVKDKLAAKAAAEAQHRTSGSLWGSLGFTVSPERLDFTRESLMAKATGDPAAIEAGEAAAALSLRGVLDNRKVVQEEVRGSGLLQKLTARMSEATPLEGGAAAAGTGCGQVGGGGFAPIIASSSVAEVEVKRQRRLRIFQEMTITGAAA